MTWIILQFVLLSGLVVLPRLFKSHNRHVARFHVEMTRNVSARKVCVQMMLIVLLLFHFVYMNGHPEDFGILFSTIECAILLSFKTADKWLRLLVDKRRVFFLQALVTVIIGFVPHLFTLSVTNAVFLLATLIYPASKELTKPEEGIIGHNQGTIPEEVADNNQENHHAELPQ